MKKYKKILNIILIILVIRLIMPANPDKPLLIKPPIFKPYIYLTRQK
jgi:hypothetical protein